MNYEHIDIDRMVMESHYLHALDIEDSQREGSLSDMERQDYIDIIKALREERVQLREMISSLQDTIKSLNQQLTRHEEIDAAKDKRIAELNEKIDKLTIALTSTTERLNIMLDEKYNKKSKSNRHDNNKPAKKSREQEKEEDDGTNINSGSGASGPTSEESLDKTKVSSENLDGKRGPRGKYTTMDAAKVVEHKTTKMPIVPPGWVFVDYKFVDEYTKYSYIKCDRFQVAIYEDEFGIRHDFFNPMADWFVKQIGRLYLVEAECFLKGLSAEETKYRRNRREVTRILESIKSKAEELLSRQRIHYSPSLRRALNYMKRGWENLIRYREDGDYSIDNSIAERAVRPYTVFRNGTMFHGSERGVENTTFFYSLIETGKARGLNVKNYLVSMIREMLHGNTDYKGILQGAYI